jgi:hypothetical protein
MLKAVSQLTDEEVNHCAKLQNQCLKLAKQNKINYKNFLKILIQRNCIRVKFESYGKFQFDMNAEPKDSLEFELTHIDIEKTREFLSTLQIKQPEYISGKCSPTCLPKMK